MLLSHLRERFTHRTSSVRLTSVLPVLTLSLAVALTSVACSRIGEGPSSTKQTLVQSQAKPTQSAFLQVTIAPSWTATPPVPTATPPPPTATSIPPTSTPVPPTATPIPPTATATPVHPLSWMSDATILGMYGRAWGVAPILGRLGMYQNADQMAVDVNKFSKEIEAVNGRKPVIAEIHLIYALAVPCSGNDVCLSYLDDVDPHLVQDYIVPAQKRGWLVFLDTQLGRSDPVSQIKRMIAKGYLKYDNVEVALDPEFHVVPGHLTPGIPVGTIEASQVNAAQQLLSNYVKQEHLAHDKILVVHQFGDQNINDGVPFMIQNKKAVRDYPNVNLVIMADGFGPPNTKVDKYNLMTDPKVYPFIHYRGIKLFPPNPYEHAGHYDQPMLTFRQVFGLDPTPGKDRMQEPPNMIIMN